MEHDNDLTKWRCADCRAVEAVLKRGLLGGHKMRG